MTKSPILLKLYALILLVISVSVPLLISYYGYTYLKTIENDQHCKTIKQNTRNFLLVYYLIIMILTGVYLLFAVPGILFTKKR